MFSTQNPNVTLNTKPHYTDENYRYPQSVFGRAENDIVYIHTDFLWKINFSKAKKSLVIADKSGKRSRSAKWYEIFLSTYLDKKIEIKHILSGWNWATGYSYIILGYKDNSESSHH